MKRKNLSQAAQIDDIDTTQLIHHYVKKKGVSTTVY